MGENSIEIDGHVYDLGDPEQRRSAIRAWLKAKAREKGSASSPDSCPAPRDPEPFAPAAAPCSAPQPTEKSL
jgi:hypothetical protein